jgi:hypothetical protein
MNIDKRTFGTIFIILSAAILLILDNYGLLEEHVGFALIAITIAFQLGQYSERKFKN